MAEFGHWRGVVVQKEALVPRRRREVYPPLHHDVVRTRRRIRPKQVATPHPGKSVSSVQIGHRSANAAARIGQSSGSMPTIVPSAAMDRRRRSEISGFPSRLATRAARYSPASANEILSECDSMMRRTRFPSTARIKMLASSTSALSGIRYRAFRLFSRPARRSSWNSSRSSSPETPHAAIMESSSFAAARMASTSALRLFFWAGM